MSCSTPVSRVQLQHMPPSNIASFLQVVYSITLHGEVLQTQFRVINTDDKPFDFSAAL